MFTGVSPFYAKIEDIIFDNIKACDWLKVVTDDYYFLEEQTANEYVKKASSGLRKML
jgi:hypothetical protein